ncbi:hypothetical protein HJC23_006560 [Cyclotella cryptica]|uniref:Chitinase n=1 Tax=Cyclotella cryptica TaxID=29204 RepID=A0ABD3PLA3_9STRA
MALYSLNGYPNHTVIDFISPDETDDDDDDDGGADDDSEWDLYSEVDVSRCAGSGPCWVLVDVTDGLLSSIQRQDSLAITFGIQVDQEPLRGAFASSNYKGERFSPQLILDFGPDQDLIPSDLTRRGNLKGSGRQSDKKKKKKKKKKKQDKAKVGNGRPGKKNKPGKNKKPAKKPGKNNGGRPFGAISIANKNPSKNDKPNKKDKPKEKQETIGSDSNRPGVNNKPNSNRPGKNKPANNKPSGDKPSNSKPNSVGPNDKPNANKPANNKPNNNNNNNANSGTTSAKEVFRILSTKESVINNKLFLYESPADGWIPSTIYNYDGLAKGLKVMNGKGVNDMYFFLGGDDEKEYKYGLTNVAAFLAQSMKETIKYDACDENSWDLVNGKYPLSNACGQLGQSYQDYHCPDNEKHMECPVDPNMEITAVTHAKWYGAPAPLFCRPKKDKNDFTGYWNYGFACNVGWVDPPITCDDYEGQTAGRFENDEPVANNSGRTDVEGCCWWGRGVIQTTGVCNFGKLNYYLGARAAKEGRDAPYPKLDFCKDPEIICSSEENKELKWIAGMFYWMESVQKYDSGGWNYMDELKAFVNGGFSDPGFINAVSGIVNRGCHNPPCGTGAVDGGPERSNNFQKALSIFGLIKLPSDDNNGSSKGDSGVVPGGDGTSSIAVCGSDWADASKCKNAKKCTTALDCPTGEYCWAGVQCSV